MSLSIELNGNSVNENWFVLPKWLSKILWISGGLQHVLLSHPFWWNKEVQAWVEKWFLLLRDDGKIDFPKLWLIGCRLLRDNDAVVALTIEEACDAAKTNNCILLNEAEVDCSDKIAKLKFFLSIENFETLFRPELQNRVGYDEDKPYVVCYWLGENNQKHLLKTHDKNGNVWYTLFLCFDKVE